MTRSVPIARPIPMRPWLLATAVSMPLSPLPSALRRNRMAAHTRPRSPGGSVRDLADHRPDGRPPPALARDGTPGPRARRAPGPPRRTALDRKSTRLNSSHSQISYAVFCLKKTQTKTKLAPPPYHYLLSQQLRHSYIAS